MADLGKKTVAGGVVGVPAAVILFVFTYFVTKDAHENSVERADKRCANIEAHIEEKSAAIEAKSDGNVPAWIYYDKVKEMESEIKMLRERLAAIEAKRAASGSPSSIPQFLPYDMLLHTNPAGPAYVDRIVIK